MNRIEIEQKLNKSRTQLIDELSQLSDEELYAPRTQSEHDPKLWWSRADHFIHTTLIEKNFNEMIRRHLAGGDGMSAMRIDGEAGEAAAHNLTDRNADWAAIMRRVNAFTEKWAVEHRGKPLDELVRIGAEVRGDTLQLLSSLSDDDLAQKIPGAPWAHGIIGGILAVNADHALAHHEYGRDDAEQHAHP